MTFSKIHELATLAVGIVAVVIENLAISDQVIPVHQIMGVLTIQLRSV